MENTKLISTHEVARIIGIHRDTLLRWLREKKIKEPKRDRNGWRIFTNKDIDDIKKFAFNIISQSINNDVPYKEQIQHLTTLDWDFVTADTEYLNHSIHPYPCKFIPQIPNTLIQSLSSVGEMVLDPFCGSGTTLVEALRLNRETIGIDANPIAALISRVKTRLINKKEEQIIGNIISEYNDRSLFLKSKQHNLFTNVENNVSNNFDDEAQRWINEWYEHFVISELLDIKATCDNIENEKVKDILLAALSSILVSVSKQDSDTRYVKRSKNIKKGNTLYKFAKSLENVLYQVVQFSKEINPKLNSTIICCNVLENPIVKKADLVVCSPPYPNAYSYHLYHRSRMLWLGMDPYSFKAIEIGSHRKYSAKGKSAATIDTFIKELTSILLWLSTIVTKDRFVCFVLGDSIIGGKLYKNDEIFINASTKLGFKLEANIPRNILTTKKYFNPSLGKIKDEHIIILRNAQG